VGVRRRPYLTCHFLIQGAVLIEAIKFFCRSHTAIPIAGLTLISSVLMVAQAPAQDLPKLEATFANGGTLRFYGQINKGVLTFDDGQISKTYTLIDNYNSNTRFGLTYNQTFGEGWSYLGTVEIQYDPFSTNSASILEQSPPSSAYGFSNSNIRKIDNRFSNDAFGAIWIGQGDMASNNTAEVDLSGTRVISYSSVSDSAAAQLLRQSDGSLSDITIADAFTNMDGLSRQVRIRYDTPLMSGFGLRTSFGRDLLSDEEEVREENLFDIAATYSGKINDFQIEAQTAYSWKGSDTTILDGSASVLHGPTGLSATAAIGMQDSDGLNGSYGYVKLGWESHLIAAGTTAFSVDYYGGSDIGLAGSDSTSFALSVVQNLPRYNTELWLTWRNFDYSNTTSTFEFASAVFMGARFAF
jgi:hypothetical protein